MALPQWKIDMINWPLTQTTFGYQDIAQLRSKSKVFLNCIVCNKGYQTSPIKMRAGYVARCISCRTKAAFASPEARKLISERSKSHRNTPEAKARQSEITKLMWQNTGSREKLMTSFNEPVYLEGASARSKELWNDPKYREHMRAAQTSDEYREHHRKKSKELWEDPEYVQKVKDGFSNMVLTPEQVERRSQRSIAFWMDQEYRTKQHITRGTAEFKAAQSARARAIWTDEYRARVMEYRQSDEFRAKASAISKALWADPEYHDKLMAIKSDENYKADRSTDMVRLWQDPGHRAHLEAIYATPEYREKMSALGVERWKDDDYGRKISQAMAELWADDAYRSRITEAMSRPEVMLKIANSRARQRRISVPQCRLYEILEELNIKHVKEGPETIVGNRIFDCLIPGVDGNKHLLIECQGDYWHRLNGRVSKDKKKYDEVLADHPEYDILHIWECEIYCQDRVRDRLNLAHGIEPTQNVFDFKNVVLRRPRARELKAFLNTYHYIGQGRGGSSWGAYFGDKLIGCAVYSPVLRQNTAGQFGLESDAVVELSRLCIHPLYQKKNFASWLIGKTIKQVKADLVVSYADSTIGHTGTVYKAANFTLHHVVRPDYWYVGQDGAVIHKRTLYGWAVKAGVTEREFAEFNEYEKNWGGEKYCYIRHI